MTDLRERIAADILEFFEWDIDGLDEAAEELADRILALLPKMPELRWDDSRNFLFLGRLFVGYIGSPGDNCWCGYIVSDDIDGTDEVTHLATTETAARAAVEKAVREALGMETAK